MYDKNNTLIFSSVFLWNEVDRIRGELHLMAEKLVFIAEGFEQTHLQLSIPLSHIAKIVDYKLYDIAVAGLQINTFEGKITVFILENASLLKKSLLEEIDNRTTN